MKFLFTWFFLSALFVFLLFFLALPKKVSIAISLGSTWLRLLINVQGVAPAPASASYFVWSLKKYAQINFVLFPLKQI